MKKILKEILADPLTGKDLSEEKKDGKEFLRSENNEYPLIENVPVLLSEEGQKIISSDLHKKNNSEFNYREHYQEDASFFDYFKQEETLAGKEESRRLHQMISTHVEEKSKFILDVGCGNGWVAKHFLAKGKKVISMDISSQNPVRVLSENPGENHAAVVADAFFPPFKEESFDLIIAAEIMEHVADPKQFIFKLMKILKPGGKLIITTPYDEKIEYYLCIHCNKPTPKNAHLHSFNENNIGNFIPADFEYSSKKFSNKYLVRLRLNLLFSFLPFFLWKWMDTTANEIFKRPTRFLLEIKRK